MQIEISYQDQVELERICTEKGWSYSDFFKQLLDGYRKFGFSEEKTEKPENIKFSPTTKSLEDSVEKVRIEDESETVESEEDKGDVKEVKEKPKRRGRPPKAK